MAVVQLPEVFLRDHDLLVAKQSETGAIFGLPNPSTTTSEKYKIRSQGFYLDFKDTARVTKNINLIIIK